VLRLATTTSTYDSGLLDVILPQFETEFNVQVDVVAVGTGQALAIGARGDADVVLVHARAREDQFVADGHAPARYDVMYNDFVIVGPPDDMAGIRGVPTAAEAFEKIADAGTPFASRGDDSGTHTKERGIWAKAGLEPGSNDGWYNSLGQGMGNTLIFANEQRAYTLTDRGTFLSMKNQLPNLTILVGGDSIANNPDPMLYNPYGVMPINPAKHPGVNYDLAMKFVRWLTSKPTQERIAEFGVARFGQPLFYPNSVTSDQ
jgi:tungstate transport system substrate-binding protein